MAQLPGGAGLFSDLGLVPRRGSLLWGGTSVCAWGVHLSPPLCRPPLGPRPSQGWRLGAKRCPCPNPISSPSLSAFGLNSPGLLQPALSPKARSPVYPVHSSAVSHCMTPALGSCVLGMGDRGTLTQGKGSSKGPADGRGR